MKKFIFDLQRFAVIENHESGYEYDDTIRNVIGTDDDDTIRNWGSNVSIQALEGDDYIYNERG